MTPSWTQYWTERSAEPEAASSSLWEIRISICRLRLSSSSPRETPRWGANHRYSILQGSLWMTLPSCRILKSNVALEHQVCPFLVYHQLSHSDWWLIWTQVEFPPDLCSRVTFVNFTVTRSSLQSQCLNEVLKAERPDVDEKRSDLLKLQGARNDHEMMTSRDGCWNRY